uniref:Uncharacterized protein n=1 Tax=Picea sitchensis TaxID=3332 RepID=A9NTY8_PICSI|nr:unknown [Picea sitchensis]
MRLVFHFLRTLPYCFPNLFCVLSNQVNCDPLWKLVTENVVTTSHCLTSKNELYCERSRNQKSNGSTVQINRFITSNRRRT